MSVGIEKYKDYLENAMGYYYDELEFLKHFFKVPKTRYHTFKYALDYIKNNNLKYILELGTSRSYVDGRFEGCNMSDIKYWEPSNPDKWDWSAGLFTRVFSEDLSSNNKQFFLDTVDCCEEHLERSKNIVDKYGKNVRFIHSKSEDFLKSTNKHYDVIYLDTGDMTPVEETALLQLMESHIIVERNLLNENGIIIIDDVKNPAPKQAGETNNYGKAKYSIPYLLENGFEILVDEYQVILKKTK